MDTRAKKIKIGIAFEGRRDIKPLEILIDRILKPHYSPYIIKRLTPHTGLIGYTKLYTKNFFEVGESVDIAIFVTDQDKQSRSVKRTMLKKIDEANPTYKQFSVVGVPDPHFEAWLLADHGFVKSYFSLNATDPFPNISDSPKQTLEYLRNHMENPKPPLFQIYEDLAESVSLNATRTLKNFASELFSTCRLIA